MKAGLDLAQAEYFRFRKLKPCLPRRESSVHNLAVGDHRSQDRCAKESTERGSKCTADDQLVFPSPWLGRALRSFQFRSLPELFHPLTLSAHFCAGLDSRRREFRITSRVAPVSARMASQRPAMPRKARMRKTALIASAKVTLKRMMRSVRRPRITGFRDFGEIVLHESDVRRLDGGIAADGSHGEANAGDGKRGRVVHAVADHADVGVLGDELADVFDLLLRHEVADGFVDARLFGDGGGGALVVAAEHDDLFDPRSVDETKRFGHLGAQGIGNGDDAENFARASFMRRVAEDGEGLALRFDACENGLDRWAANSCLVGHAVIADEMRVAVRWWRGLPVR